MRQVRGPRLWMGLRPGRRMQLVEPGPWWTPSGDHLAWGYLTHLKAKKRLRHCPGLAGWKEAAFSLSPGGQLVLLAACAVVTWLLGMLYQVCPPLHCHPHIDACSHTEATVNDSQWTSPALPSPSWQLSVLWRQLRWQKGLQQGHREGHRWSSRHSRAVLQEVDGCFQSL